jgi:hypothetical protein
MYGGGLQPEQKQDKRKQFQFVLSGRDDKIRTCDHTPPRRVRYRAALHPEELQI